MKTASHILAALLILMSTTACSAAAEEASENNLIVTVKRTQPKDYSRSAFDDLEPTPTDESAQAASEAGHAPASATGPISINVGSKKMGESVLIKPESK